MQLAFTAAILGLAVLYTYWAFGDLSFLSSTGRLGPGFFPRIVNVHCSKPGFLALAVHDRRGSIRIDSVA